MILDRASWRAELLRTGNIPPDGDGPVDPDQAGRDCLRYVELVGMVEGTEGREVFDALLDSMQVPADYEVYESTTGALHRFTDPAAGAWLFDGWFALATRAPDKAWDLLNQLARGWLPRDQLRRFNEAWGHADRSARDALLAEVLEQERDGWLDDPAARGALRPIEDPRP